MAKKKKSKSLKRTSKKRRTYTHKGLKKGWAINWDAKIIYKISKMPKKSKKFKPW